MKYTIGLVCLLIIITAIGGYVFIRQNNRETNSPVLGINATGNNEELTNEQLPTVEIKSATSSARLLIPNYMSQTFNNCGPANLSMILNYWGESYTQQQLAEILRPFNNPNGGVDDKSVFNSEMAAFAKQNGYESLVRPNGSIDKLKQFTTNGIPVVVSAWLHPNEDIGHYRLVKGFDENSQGILTDDSYTGPNQMVEYQSFVEMWKPFNYVYLIIYPEEKSDVVNKILGEETDMNHSYQMAITNAQKELSKNTEDTYAQFNMATANYYLGNFSETKYWYEKAESKLPNRMLWYQYEPLLAYQQLGEDQKALDGADKLLANANRAFAEMYQLKGEIYQKKGQKEQAKQMFEQAIYYNKNYDKPKESLKSLDI